MSKFRVKMWEFISRQLVAPFLLIKILLYPTLTGSKTPTSKFSKAKKLGGDQLPVKARLVRADNQWG
ncbi:hypothetical protein BK710_23720 [Bacillus thuringiensis serovar sumiyoshiensis]|nr:hypothetical protein BK710_23720 [Bacillus thuringiensis serovar sumiyoshiensis]OTW98604.1 hypothetical protein BK711_16160 [Bacillus thuringiensis serovar fukuokaensis]